MVWKGSEAAGNQCEQSCEEAWKITHTHTHTHTLESNAEKTKKHDTQKNPSPTENTNKNKHTTNITSPKQPQQTTKQQQRPAGMVSALALHPVRASPDGPRGDTPGPLEPARLRV